MRRVILLLVDGLRPDVAEAALEAGQLPAFAAMTRDAGIARGITVFPSTTNVAYLPFLSGCTPGTANIPSIRWLDRARYGGRWWRERDMVRSYCGYQVSRLDADIAPSVPLIFELVPESLAIFTPITRGLTSERDAGRGERKFWGALAHYAQWHQPSDDAVTRHLLREVDQDWRFIFAQFPAVDGYTHQSTPDGRRVLRALRKVDDTVARLRSRLAARGELEDTLILMVSDHGATPVHTHLDLADWFRGQGVPTMSHPVIWEKEPRAAVMVAGNGSAMVYARPGAPRPDRLPMAALRRPAGFGAKHDVIAALVAEPAVAFVAAEEAPGSVRVADASGEAMIEVEGERGTGNGNRSTGNGPSGAADPIISYRPLTGDPLGMDGPFEASASDWLDATWDSTYPDACIQLLDQFRAARTGDLIVVAREGYDFRKRFEVPEHKSGHGSLIRAHMQVPVWSSVPAPATPVRTVDLFPLMLDWLGVPVPDGIDGRRPQSHGVPGTVA